MEDKNGNTPLEEIIGFLDEGETPVEVEDNFYNNVIRPVIEDETGLEHPDEFEMMEYESGRQIMYDVLNSTAEVIEEDAPRVDTNTLDPSWRNNPKMKAMMVAAEGAIWASRKMLESFSDNMMGVADLDMITMDPEKVPDMAYTTDNIAKFANRQDIGYNAAEAYVKTHEGIHLAQFHTHPELQERRLEIMKSDEPNPGPLDVDLEEIQGLMSVIEGHAEFYTNKAFDTIANVEVDREGGLKKKLLKKVHPLYRMAHRQYEDGSDFIETLHKQGGDWLTEKALENPPTTEEIDNPGQWIERTNPYHSQTYEESWESHLEAENVEVH